MVSGFVLFLLLGLNLLIGVAVGWYVGRVYGRPAVTSIEATANVLDEVKAETDRYNSDLKVFGDDIAEDNNESALRKQLISFQQRNSAYQDQLHTGVTRLSHVASLGDEVLRQVVFELVKHTGDVCRFGEMLQANLAGQLPPEAQQIVGSAIGELLTSNQRLEQELSAARDELDHHRKELDEAKREARVDPLTKIPNRRGFEEQLAIAFSKYRRDQAEYAIAMLDIDHFKQINDTHGHSAGDSVLEVVGHLLSTSIRPYDTVGRIGGEEFALLLPGATPLEAEVVAERCRKKIEAAAVRVNDASLTFRISVGIAGVRSTDANAHVAMNRADAALYLAKENGRNQVRIAEVENAA